MNELLVGAILAVSLVIGLFFLRFWRSTGDRFFVYFTLSFWIAGADHLLLLPAGRRDSVSEYYIFRILAYALIAAAILRKNRESRRKRLKEEQ
jgi:Family of unknown function (DUF5985)